MMGFTFIAAIFVLLLGGATGSIVGWLKGPLAGIAACLVVLMAGLLGYVGLITLATGM